MKSNLSNSLVVQTESRKNLISFDTIYGKESIFINAPIEVSGNLLNFTKPKTSLIIPNNQKNAFGIQPNNLDLDNRIPSLISIDTDAPVAKLNINSNFVLTGVSNHMHKT